MWVDDTKIAQVSSMLRWVGIGKGRGGEVVFIAWRFNVDGGGRARFVWWKKMVILP